MGGFSRRGLVACLVLSRERVVLTRKRGACRKEEEGWLMACWAPREVEDEEAKDTRKEEDDDDTCVLYGRGS